MDGGDDQILVNRENVPVFRGEFDGYGFGGDTGLWPNELYYCGREMGHCRDGKCGKICGPTSGCPCKSCLMLVNMAINRNGDLCKRGSGESTKLGGDTGFRPSNIFYCKKTYIKKLCRCGTCSPGYICGGKEKFSKGCPCLPCLEVSDLKRHNKLVLNKDGALAKRGGWNGGPGIRLEGQKVSPTLLFYCGRQMKECRCGSCDRQCGPSHGCPCNSCREVNKPFLLTRMKSLEGESMYSLSDAKSTFESVNLNQPANKFGYIMKSGVGNFPESGGDTNMSPSELFYCGVRTNDCRCGNCDGVCGPANGCPCNACLEVVFGRILDISQEHVQTPIENNHQVATASAPPSIDAGNSTKTTVQVNEDSDEADCVICLSSPKTAILIPCGHFGFCMECPVNLTECPLCRAPIQSFVRVYMP